MPDAQKLSASPSRLSLRSLLGLGAASLGIGTCLTALILWLGMTNVASRLDTALEAERRMAGYASLSTQAATFLVVATEAVQRELPYDVRVARMEPVAQTLRATFARMQEDVAIAVQSAQDLGVDQQSRYGTQSLGLARMQALLDTTLRGLSEKTDSKPALQASIDTFASGFDPLLSQAVNTEILLRNAVLLEIDELRQKLSVAAIAIVTVTILMVTGFYFVLVRPQFRRLDQLRLAAQKIGQAEFAVDLPQTRQDEIGQLFGETARMAHALAARQEDVETEWARLNETIEERTEALRSANATLAEIDENRRRFFADISHELRTPLTVILMEAQIGAQTDGCNRDAFATIKARASRLNRRIDDLLRVARSDSGQLALDPQSVHLPALWNEIREEIQAEVNTAGMHLDMSTPPDLQVHCDPNWLRQVLVSLVRNAIRHARDGKFVALHAEDSGSDITLAVIDNGPGINAKDQAVVFERFTQSGIANAHGFGVGLALARWVIESQRGKITLQSPLPRDAALGDAPGTKIAVRLPHADDYTERA